MNKKCLSIILIGFFVFTFLSLNFISAENSVVNSPSDKGTFTTTITYGDYQKPNIFSVIGDFMHNLFSIISNKQTYEQGETATVTSGISIDSCSSAKVIVQVINGQGLILDTKTVNLGSVSMKSVTATTTVTFNSITYPPGTYVLKNTWYCGSSLLTPGLGGGNNPDQIPVIVVKKTSTCTESWSCGNWGVCLTGNYQTRYCEDLNSCGTTFTKPPITQTCTASVCTQGQTKCESTNYFTCYNDQWIFNGQVDGQCGYTVGNTCVDDSDLNCDGKVDRNELGQYINLWIVNSITRDALGKAINLWANG